MGPARHPDSLRRAHLMALVVVSPLSLDLIRSEEVCSGKLVVMPLCFPSLTLSAPAHLVQCEVQYLQGYLDMMAHDLSVHQPWHHSFLGLQANPSRPEWVNQFWAKPHQSKMRSWN